MLPYSAHKLRPKCIYYNGDDTCSVCLNNLHSHKAKKKRSAIRKLPCGHLFHSKCILQWEDISKEKTCPMCRHNYFFQIWHSVDPYENGKYRRTIFVTSKRNRLSIVCYNNRYHPSMYNFVLFEFRRYVRLCEKKYYLHYHNNLIIDASIFKQTKRLASDMMIGPNLNNYFKF
jgi:hypothetical protein